MHTSLMLLFREYFARELYSKSEHSNNTLTVTTRVTSLEINRTTFLTSSPVELLKHESIETRLISKLPVSQLQTIILLCFLLLEQCREAFYSNELHREIGKCVLLVICFYTCYVGIVFCRCDCHHFGQIDN